MNTYFKCLLIVIPLFFSTQSHAQDDVWTLKECIDYALENNVILKRSDLNRQLEEINYRQSKYNLLPSINGSGSYGYNWGRSIDPTTNQFLSRRIEFASGSANANVTIFSGMQLVNSIKQSQLLLEASEMDVEATKNDVLFTIIALYTNIIFNKELLENARSQQASTEKELLRVRRQVEAGALALGDQLELEAQIATNELTVIQQQNALDLSLLQLKQALQLPGETPFQVVVPEQIQSTVLTTSMMNNTAEDVFKTALDNLPEIKAARKRIEVADIGVRIAKGGFYPSVGASAGLRSNYSDASARFSVSGASEEVVQGLRTQGGEAIVQLVPEGDYEAVAFSDQLDENLSKSLSLGINIPIFNNFSTKSAVQRAVINQHLATLNLQDTKSTVRQDIETAYNDVLAAAKSYAAAVKQVEAREESFRMVAKRRDAGAATIIDYQLAENSLFQAKSDLLRAKYDYIFKTKLLDFYLGNPIEL